MDWVRHKKVAVGDQITIRVLESPSANKPKRRTPVDGTRRRLNAKRQFEWAKKFYFENRSKFEKRKKTRSG